jgi:uncharacterized membrane protein (DUF485 family)
MFTFTLLVACIGAALAFSVGEHTERLHGKIGGVMVVVALVVMFVLTAVGFVVAAKGVWENFRRSQRDDVTTRVDPPST